MSRKVTFLSGKPPYSNCTGCRTCEVICSLVHEKTCNPRNGRIIVTRVEPAGNSATVCHQCRTPLCASRCPVQALAYDKDTRMVVVNEKKCIGCGTCVEDCPFGAIRVHLSTGKAIKCDLCQGSYSTPACVEFCAPGVLTFTDINALPYKKARNNALVSVKPEQKRQVGAKSQLH